MQSILVRICVLLHNYTYIALVIINYLQSSYITDLLNMLNILRSGGVFLPDKPYWNAAETNMCLHYL